MTIPPKNRDSFSDFEIIDQFSVSRKRQLNFNILLREALTDAEKKDDSTDQNLLKKSDDDTDDMPETGDEIRSNE